MRSLNDNKLTPIQQVKAHTVKSILGHMRSMFDFEDDYGLKIGMLKNEIMFHKKI